MMKFKNPIQKLKYGKLMKDFNNIKRFLSKLQPMQSWDLDWAEKQTLENIKSFIYYYTNHTPTKEVLQNFFDFMDSK